MCFSFRTNLNTSPNCPNCLLILKVAKLVQYFILVISIDAFCCCFPTPFVVVSPFVVVFPFLLLFSPLSSNVWLKLVQGHSNMFIKLNQKDVYIQYRNKYYNPFVFVLNRLSKLWLRSRIECPNVYDIPRELSCRINYHTIR